MKLAVFNGSPRGKLSNTSVLLSFFINGLKSRGGEVTSYDLLIREEDLDEHVNHFKKADSVMLATPLYVDSVPGMVKKFIETIGNYDGAGKKILFLVHSGFPEGIHSQGVINYFQFLVKRWNMNCAGIILLPGSEGIRMRQEAKSLKLFRKFELIGESLALNNVSDPVIIKKLKHPYKFPKMVIWMMGIMMKSGMFDRYWKTKLKENNAWEKRFDAPYWQK